VQGSQQNSTNGPDAPLMPSGAQCSLPSPTSPCDSQTALVPRSGLDSFYQALPCVLIKWSWTVLQSRFLDLPFKSWFWPL